MSEREYNFEKMTEISISVLNSPCLEYGWDFHGVNLIINFSNYCVFRLDVGTLDNFKRNGRDFNRHAIAIVWFPAA